MLTSANNIVQRLTKKRERAADRDEEEASSGVRKHSPEFGFMREQTLYVFMDRENLKGQKCRNKRRTNQAE
jgi:hypothetical protein